MIEEHRPPISIFGIRLKPLIVFIIFLFSLLIVFDSLDFKRFVSDYRPFPPSEKATEKITPDQNINDIVATPEMISKAMKEIQLEKVQQIETKENVLPEDRFFYIVELTTGGNLEAMDVVMEPDEVIILSSSGIRTVIPRNSVKKISRFKLPPLQQ